MGNSHFSRLPWLLLLVGLLFALGCSATTEKSRFYKLNSLTGAESIANTQTTGAGVAIGIGPIKFPDHLDRPEIVTRTSGNALQLAEFHRWAGSLEKDFSRILAENLSILLSTDYIFMFPFAQATPIDYRVAVEVVRFDGELGKSATLIARWTMIEEGEEKTLKSIRRSQVTEPADGNSYEAMVAALSRTVEDLSREIAETIQTFSQKGK
ncbi:MAG: hypothetical protein AMK69_24290 [Nitrospira bacterium SG8_3]|nr:MAG: hypothetical protein AMK69_24290 [Nitrospira bacterium SG8_3]